MVINNTSIPSHYPPPPAPDLFSQGRRQEPEASRQNADPRLQRILDYLRPRRWVHRAEVFAACEVSDRVGRDLVESSNGLVISDSALGYLHTLNATPQEIAHFDNEMASRERHHAQRRIAVSRVYHSYGRAT